MKQTGIKLNHELARTVKKAARRALPENLLTQYFDRSQIRLTGEELADSYSRKLLLFRIGDYLNAYGDTAEIIAEIIGLTICSHQGFASTAFPYTLETEYIRQIGRAGFGVRIEEPTFEAEAKGGA